MRKNKDAYMNFVCPHCFNTLNKCTCEVFPPYHLIFIDRNIQEHIRILNEKGYKTMACCEGHKTGCLNTYIAFPYDYFVETGVAEGFKCVKERNSSLTTISYLYSSKLTEEAMEEMKKEKLKVLLDWVKNLPIRKN